MEFYIRIGERGLKNLMYAYKVKNLTKNCKEITVGQAHINTRELNQNISTGSAVFLNQKRANVCEHTTKMASLESL
jgi:hypothetical protein